MQSEKIVILWDKIVVLKGDRKMDLFEIAQAVGIAKCPDFLIDVYERLPEDTGPACDLELIDRLQEEFNLFDEFYDVVKQTAIQINQDAYRSAWIKTAVAYAKDKNVTDARRVPVPKADGTQITALLPLYILLPQIPMGIESYRQRGFSEAELAALIKSYANGIRTVESQTGMPGINWLYYYWLTLYVKAMIFNTEGLQFELRYVPNAAIYLKHRHNNQILMLATAGTFHATGIQPLGSPGYTDEEGAFKADFAEDETAYHGHAIVDSRVETERKSYLKADWECVLRPGDQCLSLHIPKKADISPENMERAMASARNIVKERYPEHTGMSLFGSSWILDPKLKELLGEQSKISQLINMFYKYPQKCGGTGVFGYVFPKNYESLQTLPEDTSLQRKLKQHYIDGNFIYDYAGFIL